MGSAKGFQTLLVDNDGKAAREGGVEEVESVVLQFSLQTNKGPFYEIDILVTIETEVHVESLAVDTSCCFRKYELLQSPANLYQTAT